MGCGVSAASHGSVNHGSKTIGAACGSGIWKDKEVPQQPLEPGVIPSAMLPEADLFRDEDFDGRPENDGTRRPGRNGGFWQDGQLKLFGSTSAMSVIQGDRDDCWLVSALACVAEKPGEIQARCKQQQLSADGRYDIKLFHPVHNQWMELQVDDRLSIDDDRPGPCNPLCMQISREGELWGPLYEKVPILWPASMESSFN